MTSDDSRPALYLFVDEDGAGRRVPLDEANVERQMRDLRAAGHSPYLLDQDELINLGITQRRLRDQQTD
jgi:hypothetical protein